MPKTSDKTQLLFIGSSPRDQAALELPKEFNDIACLLPRTHFIAESRWGEPASNLPDLMQEYRPRLLHFSGHGSSAGKLLFEDEDGSFEPDPDAIAEVFARAQPGVHCVVLNACYSAQQAERIAKHVDFVIGMSDAITDTYARAFTKGFYGALGRGQSVRDAFNHAKLKLDLTRQGSQHLLRLLVNTDAEETSLRQALAGEPREQAARDRLARERIDFRSERRRHKYGFFGREKLLDELDHAIDDSGVDWLLLTGGWGLGKSALMNAWLTGREDARKFTAAHFIRAGVLNWDDPGAIRRNLSAQIEQHHPAHQYQWPDDPDRLQSVLAGVGSDLAARGQRLVVLVDGLDEALADPKRETTLSAFLPHAQLEGVVFVVSSRPHAQVLRWFEQRTDDRVRRIDLDAQPHTNLGAVAQFWRHHRPSAFGDSLSDEQLGGLVESSEGNFLHAVQALKEASESGDKLVLSRPRGLRNFLETLWSDLSRLPPSDQRPILAGLVVLCLSKRALPLSAIEQIVDDWPVFGRERLLEATGNFLLAERSSLRSTTEEYCYRPSHEVVRELVIERCHTIVDETLKSIGAWARWPVAEHGTMRWFYALNHSLDHAIELGDVDTAVQTCLRVDYLDEKFQLRGAEAIERELRRVMALANGEERNVLRDVLMIIECGYQWLITLPDPGALRSILFCQSLNLWGTNNAVLGRLTWDRLPPLRPRAPVSKHAMVMQLFGHRARITDVATLGDGRLASVADGGELFIWDLPHHRPERRLHFPVEPFTNIELVPANDCQALLVAESGRVQLVDCNTGEVHADIQPRGTKVAAIGERVFALVEGKLEQCWPPGYIASGAGDLTTLCSITAIGDRLALGAEDGTINIWDGTSPPLALPGQGNRISQLAAAGGKLVSLSVDGTVGVWSLNPPELIHIIRTGGAFTLSTSPDGTTLFVRMRDLSLRAWSLDSGAPLGFIHERSSLLSMAAIDSRRVAAPSTLYYAVNIDHLLLESPTHASPPGPGDPFRKNLLLVDGTLICGQGTEIERLNVTTGEIEASSSVAGTPRIYDLSAIAARWLFIAGGEGLVGLLELDSCNQQTLMRIECEYPDDDLQFEDATHIAAAPSGVVVVASSDIPIHIIDLRHGNENHSLVLDEDGWETTDIIHLHDEVFALIDEHAIVRVVDVIRHELDQLDICARLDIPRLSGNSLAKLADGRIACGLNRGAIMIWDPGSDTTMLRVQHWGAINDIFPLPCGGFWAASGDGSLGRWSAEGERLATSYGGAALSSVVEVAGEVIVRDVLGNTWVLELDPPAVRERSAVHNRRPRG